MMWLPRGMYGMQIFESTIGAVQLTITDLFNLSSLKSTDGIKIRRAGAVDEIPDFRLFFFNDFPEALKLVIRRQIELQLP